LNAIKHTIKTSGPGTRPASASCFFQPKLSINQPNDPDSYRYEREADAIADKVVGMKTPSTEQAFFAPPVMQRKESYNETTGATPETENYLSSLSGGKTLSNEEKSFFEPGMGYDFSDVKIHTGSAANESAKNINALAYTHGNNIVFGSNQYQPDTYEGKKLLAHELAHVVQQNGNLSKKIQTKRELDATTEKDTHTKCLGAIGSTITKLEANVTKTGMPDDIKEAVKLLRKKFTENKIKCYYLDGNAHGETNFTTGEIYMDAKLLEGTTDVFANIGEGNVLHEGIHALHNEKYPVSTKKYGKALDEKNAGKSSGLSDAEEKDLKRLDAWTEYWAYRKMQEYDNTKNSKGKNDDSLHNDTIKDMKTRHAILPLNVVWAFDPNWDPRKWKPKN
jgi:hypothetical protein